MRRVLAIVTLALVLLGAFSSHADVVATYNSATDVPVTATNFSAAGATFSAALNFAPPVGTNLTVVNNTGLAFISGSFTNLSHGQILTLSYGGVNYRFVANYYGGTGNDLVLQWANVRPMAWGYNFEGMLGDFSTANRKVPSNCYSAGVLANKTILGTSAGLYHSLAVCSDGTVAAWGRNGGSLGNNGTDSLEPVAVDTTGVLAGKRVIVVAAGNRHSLALCSDGTVAAWGTNLTGELGTGGSASSNVPVAVNTSGVLSGKAVVSIAAGLYNSTALCSDGTIAVWGSNNLSPVLLSPAGALAGKSVIRVATGQSHGLALCSDGTIAAWGDNTFGALGNNSTSSSEVPVAVSTAGVLAGKTVVDVKAGLYHSLALCSDGTVAAWGYNTSGQLGNGSGNFSHTVPVAVSTTTWLAGRTVVAIASGAEHSMAVCSDGTIAMWGLNSYGQLGNNNFTNNKQPVGVSSVNLTPGERYTAGFSGPMAQYNLGTVASPFVPIVIRSAATNVTGSGVTLNGTINPNGNATSAFVEYGPTTNYGSSVAVPLSPNDGVSAQSVSSQLNGLSPGTVYHYRFTATNVLGTISSSDGTFATATGVSSVLSSPAHVPVITSQFSARGELLNIALGFAPEAGTNLMIVKNTGLDFIDGTFSNLAQGQLIVLPFGGINYRFVANYYGGDGNDLILQWAQSRPASWGANSSRQVDFRTYVNRLAPFDVPLVGALSGKIVISMATGTAHTLALCADGTIAAWGDNSSGRLGNGNSDPAYVPVSVLGTGVLAGKTVVAIAAGNDFSLALCSDGTLAGWGANYYGQLGNGLTNTTSSSPIAVDRTGVLAGKTVVAIAAGDLDSLALCSDGTVVTWGWRAGTRRPMLVGMTGALEGKLPVAIAKGGDFNLVLCSDGSVAYWGYNAVGQLGNNSTFLSDAPVAVSTQGVLNGKAVVAIAAGDEHSLALCSDGTLVAWGQNAYGVLGNNSGNSSSVPVAVNTAGVLSGKTIVDVGAAVEHSLAICSDGTIASWGRNTSGQLGDATTTNSPVPVAVSSQSLAAGERYVAACTGYNGSHSATIIASPISPSVTGLQPTNPTKAGITLNGRINPNGSPVTAYFEYGLDANYGSTISLSLSPNDGLTPQAVSANLTGLSSGIVYHYRLIAANATRTVSSADAIFVTSADVTANFQSVLDVPVMANIFSAGAATFSATLNFVPINGNDLTVVKNTGLGFINGKFSNLAQGQLVTLSYGGITYRYIANYYGGSGNDLVLEWAQRRLIAWGENQAGALGDGTTTDRLVPVKVPLVGALAGKTVLSAASGTAHTIALCSDGTVATWGDNWEGELGNNSTVSFSVVPVEVDRSGVLAEKEVVSVVGGDYSSFALCSDGTVAAWGHGPFGNTTPGSSKVPVAVDTTGVLAGKTVVAVSSGGGHCLGLCVDGTVVAWGNNSGGQLGDGGTVESIVPVNVTTSGALAGKFVIAVAASVDLSLALCSDGTLVKWGEGKPSPAAVSPPGVLAGKTVIAIASGLNHILALCSDGTLAAWGYNGYGQLGNGTTTSQAAPVAVRSDGALSGRTVAGLAAGIFNSFAVCSDGAGAAWGFNPAGALGNGTTINSSVPVLVSTNLLSTGERIDSIFGGSSAGHFTAVVVSSALPTTSSLSISNPTTAGITFNGAVNPNGIPATAQFEYGTTTSYGNSVGIVLAPNDGLVAQNVSATVIGLVPGTTYHYRLTAGNVLGMASTMDGTFISPTDLSATYAGPSDIPLTASGFTATGGVFSATLNFAPTTGTTLMVVQNTGLNPIDGRFANLAQGATRTLSYGGINYQFTANYFGGTGNDLVLQWFKARLVGWGENTHGQVGDNSTTGRLAPVNVVSSGILNGKTVISAAAGSQHSLALCSDGTVASWGYNFSGQLGNSSTNETRVPGAITTSGALSGKRVVALAAGQNHSLVLCSDGTLAAWGESSKGQLGNGSTSPPSLSVPSTVSATGLLSGRTVTSVAAGGSHNLARCSDGSVAVWGSNTVGQLGIANTTNSSVPVGVNSAGALSGKSVISVAAGASHSLVLCSDGSMAAWGANNSGQLGNNNTTNSNVPVAVALGGVLAGRTVTAIAAGGNHSLALCSDGTLVAWGDNAFGQLGNNSTTNSAVAVEVNRAGLLSGKTIVTIGGGALHSFAVSSDGSIATWGAGNFGQLGNGGTTQSLVPVAVNTSLFAVGERYSGSFSGSSASYNLGLIASPPVPTATTLSATNVTSGGATVMGTVNGATGSAVVSFNYGLSTSYGLTATGIPTPVTGTNDVAVSASLSGLTPNRTYHYRVRATNAGGTTNGADMTFTTPPDTTGPAGGTMSLVPGSPVDPGASLTITYANWSDVSGPLAYSVHIDDVIVSAQGASASRSVSAPVASGAHTLKGQISDGLGNITEVTQSFTVIATREEWRMFYFGSPENAGNGADSADPDGDGLTNDFEYVAGLVPTSPLSRFNLRAEKSAAQPGRMAIVFSPLVAGRTYAVQYKNNPNDDGWAPLTDIIVSDSGSERTIIDLAPPNAARFYRIEITRP